MKQPYFFRLTVTKAERMHTLLIPTINPTFDVKQVSLAWASEGWSPEADLTPFPGQGINASDMREGK